MVVNQSMTLKHVTVQIVEKRSPGFQLSAVADIRKGVLQKTEGIFIIRIKNCTKYASGVH